MTRLGLLLKQISTIGLLIGSITLVLFAIRLTELQAAPVGSAGSVEAFYADPVYHPDLVLQNFVVIKQGYANSCGPTTLGMVYSYLVKPISEQELANKAGMALGERGMLPNQFVDALELVLQDAGYHVQHQVNVTDISFLEGIYAQLKRSMPVPIYFSTMNAWDKPNFDTHYSVIVGLWPQKREVVIANAYGYMETMAISDLLDAVKFNNYQNAPMAFRLGLFTGVINKSNLFLIQK